MARRHPLPEPFFPFAHRMGGLHVVWMIVPPEHDVDCRTRSDGTIEKLELLYADPETKASRPSDIFRRGPRRIDACTRLFARLSNDEGRRALQNGIRGKA